MKNWDNEGIRMLDLGYNEISDKGACQLALVRLPVQAYRLCLLSHIFSFGPAGCMTCKAMF